MNKPHALTVAFAAVLLFVGVAQAADELILPATNRVALVTCYIKASVFTSKLETATRETFSEFVGKETDTFVGEFRKQLESAGGHNPVVTAPCVLKDDEEGGVTVLVRFRMFPAAFQEDAILVETYIKSIGEDRWMSSGGAIIHSLTRGIGASRAAQEIAGKVAERIKTATRKPAPASAPVAPVPALAPAPDAAKAATDATDSAAVAKDAAKDAAESAAVAKDAAKDAVKE